MTVEQAALGIHRVLNAQMAEAIRLVSIGRGIDPRGYALLPLGGGGPMHACALADELGISSIVVPAHPGVLSAAGLLGAPVAHEVAARVPLPAGGALDPDCVAALDELRTLDAASADALMQARASDGCDSHAFRRCLLHRPVVSSGSAAATPPTRAAIYRDVPRRARPGFTATAPTCRRRSSICARCIRPSRDRRDACHDRPADTAVRLATAPFD